MKVATATRLAAKEPKYAGRQPSLTLLAEVFGVTRQCVSRWGEDIPYLRECELRLLKPHWFAGKAASNGKARAG